MAEAYWADNEYFLQLSQSIGKFAAINRISSQARAVANMYNGCISHSEALSWVLTGVTPKGLLNRKTVDEIRDQKITLWINDICDSEVKDSVVASIYASLRVHNLTYIYKNIEIVPKQARVRILTKLLWDYIH